VYKRSLKGMAVLAVLALMVLGLVFAACTPKKAEESGTTEPPPPPKVLKIGAFYPLTGANAAKGQLNQNGTNLAVADINDAGGLLGMKVEVIYEDTQSKKELVPNVVRKLIEEDDVVVLIGEVASSNSIAAAPVLKELKRPAIAPTSTNPMVVMDPSDPTKVNPYYFRACFLDPVQGAAMANFTYKSLQKTKAAVIYNIAQDYNKGLAEVFIARFKALGGEIVAEETFPEATQDFRPQLTKIKAANPDIVITPNTYAESGLILKQAKELGMEMLFMAGDSTHAPKVIEIAGEDAVQNLYLTTLYAGDDPDPKAQDFANKYKAAYNADPNSNACFSYETVMIIAEAIKKAGEPDPEKIRAAIETIKDVPVPSGTFTMDPDTHNPLNKPVVIIRVVGQDFKFVEKVLPE
jgi:branched-chain amino acid transport system substrate-binding protein